MTEYCDSASDYVVMSGDTRGWKLSTISGKSWRVWISDFRISHWTILDV